MRRSKPEPGETVRRVVVSETVYVWKLDEDGHGDWYVASGPHIITESPTWKDLGYED